MNYHDRSLLRCVLALSGALLSTALYLGTPSHVEAAPLPLYSEPTSAGSSVFSVSPAAVRGTATYYCSDGRYGSLRSRCTRGYGPGSLVVAIDRKDTPWDKGDKLTITWRGRSVTVVVVDTCGCKGDRIVDLTAEVMHRLAPGRKHLPGELHGVVISGVTTPHTIELPETDTVE